MVQTINANFNYHNAPDLSETRTAVLLKWAISLFSVKYYKIAMKVEAQREAPRGNVAGSEAV
jgi:hypothetical protein